MSCDLRGVDSSRSKRVARSSGRAYNGWGEAVDQTTLLAQSTGYFVPTPRLRSVIVQGTSGERDQVGEIRAPRIFDAVRKQNDLLRFERVDRTLIVGHEHE